MKKHIISTCLLFTSVLVMAQNSFILAKEVKLPKDSLTRLRLTKSLDGMLAQIEKPNAENNFVLPEDLLETSVLLDEFKGMTKNEKLKEDNFYKAYLSNVVRLKDSTYKLQIAYLGIQDASPVLRASFSILAKRKGENYYFYSPLKQNAASFTKTQIKNFTFYHKQKLNKSKANEFVKLTLSFDKKLKSAPVPSSYYLCSNYPDALALLGVDYKVDYAGYSATSLTGTENKCYLNVNGYLTENFSDFDPHDHWHARLRQVLSATVINRPVDEGAAYLYGGSWGLSWEDIQKRFNNYVTANPQADWLTLYNESYNFDPKFKYPLNVDFVINAFIIKKLEKEKGFEAVIELLSCGKKEKDNANYFKALERLTGIDQQSFNVEIGKLIRTN